MLFQFRIRIENIGDPPVWRKVIVPAQFSFLRFHKVIQASFGWENYHLFQFSPKGYGSFPSIGIPDPDGFDDSTNDCKKIKIAEIFNKPGQKYTYIYDFGDDWEHKITLEKITDEKSLIADCIDGDGACPPEDCGGPWGYENLKIIMGDPKNPEHNRMREWLGLNKKGKWDAQTFNLRKTSEAVRRVR